LRRIATEALQQTSAAAQTVSPTRTRATSPASGGGAAAVIAYEAGTTRTKEFTMVLRHWTSAIAMAAVLAAAPAAFAAEKAADFITKAAAANQYEIESAKIAMDKAVSPAVKDYAKKLIDDHTKAKAEMEAQVKAAGLTMTAPVLENKQLANIDNLIKANAQDLEKDFIKYQKDAHKDTIDMFKDYAKDGDNPTLKQFAAKMVPDLEGHLAQVEKLEAAR
jgi:putative membrane protein